MSKRKQSNRSLAANDLMADPRIKEAKALLRAALHDHQTALDQVQSPIPELQEEYRTVLDRFGVMRGGNLYFPYIASGIGNGPFVELRDGSVKLDFISGIGVHGFGHSHPNLLDAGIDAALCDTVMQGNLQQGSSNIELTELLLDIARHGHVKRSDSKRGNSKHSGSKLEHCFLSTSGAMANENALKIVFQKNAPADRILAFRDCFAGRSMALAQITDRPKYRDGIPVALQVDLLTYFDANDAESSMQRTLRELDEHVARFPNRHAAIWLEMIQGEGGYYPGDSTYFKAICEACRKHNIAVVVDEVQTFARTTEPFAFQHFGIEEYVDVVTIGKITQVCATLYADPFVPRPGLISQTFTGSTWAIIAAKRIVQGLIDRGNFGKDGLNMKLHDHFVSQLERLGKKHPGAISGPYGLGGMIAFTPFDGTIETTKRLCHALFEGGLMAFIAGGSPARIRFLIPIGVVTNEHIDLAAEILDLTITKVQKEFGNLIHD